MHMMQFLENININVNHSLGKFSCQLIITTIYCMYCKSIFIVLAFVLENVPVFQQLVSGNHLWTLLKIIFAHMLE